MEKVIQGEKVFLPEYNGTSIVNIPNSILQLFGVKAPFSPLKKQIFSLEKYKEKSKVVLFLFDSLGYNRLKKLGSLKDFNVSPITSVFPSTTVAALTSLYTGVPPSAHGMVGYRLFLKEFGVIANMIKLSPVGFKERDKLLDAGLNPARFLPVKTIFEILKTKNISSYAFTKMQYYESGLSALMLKGARIVPYINIVDLLINVRKILERTSGKVFITAYIDDFDTAAHYYGTETEEEQITTDIFLENLEKIFIADTVENVLVLLTSDHGQMPAPSSSKVDIKKQKWLFNRLIMPPIGEFRATYLNFRNGELEEIGDRMRREFAGKFIILKKDRAIELGLFGMGQMNQKTRDRLGDIIMVSKGTNFLSYPYGEFELKARHGGLNENEIRVPFVIMKP